MIFFIPFPGQANAYPPGPDKYGDQGYLSRQQPYPSPNSAAAQGNSHRSSKRSLQTLFI